MNSIRNISKNLSYKKISDSKKTSQDKAQSLINLEGYIKDFIYDNGFADNSVDQKITKNYVSQCKLACTLAIETVQEAKNHKGNYQDMGDKHYAGLTDETAKKLYLELIGANKNSELHKALDTICAHRNTVFKNRKYSLFGTNYTDSSQKLKNFIKTTEFSTKKVICVSEREYKYLEDSQRSKIVQEQNTSTYDVYDVPERSLNDMFHYDKQPRVDLANVCTSSNPSNFISSSGLEYMIVRGEDQADNHKMHLSAL